MTKKERDELYVRRCIVSWTDHEVKRDKVVKEARYTVQMSLTTPQLVALKNAIAFAEVNGDRRAMSLYDAVMAELLSEENM